jgi:hypothetical protein
VQIKHTSPTNLAEVARQALTYRPMQMSAPQIRQIAQARRAVRDVACPTLLDAEQPGTYAAVEAMRMAANMAAACRERATGEPCTAKHALDDAKAIVGAFLKAYHTACENR